MTDGVTDNAGGAAKSSPRLKLVFTGFVLLLFVAFSALGTWQVQRLFWKLDLIARVNVRVHASPVPAPARTDWARVDASRDEYRRVSVSGTFVHDRSALAQAVTERGPGFWLITPLVRNDGSTVLINRGFIPADSRDPANWARGNFNGNTEITGLLRMSEPGGGFLRANDPANDRWFSRDVAAIGAAKGLSDVAPFFIDADGTPNPGGLPIGGMTVVSFRNSHLVYALTWYALAGMSLLAVYFIHRRRPG